MQYRALRKTGKRPHSFDMLIETHLCGWRGEVLQRMGFKERMLSAFIEHPKARNGIARCAAEDSTALGFLYLVARAITG